jgi:hypothetical protein
MAYTLADLDAIRSAKAKGERMVMFSDRSVTYRSMDELRQAENDIISELRATGVLPPRSRQTLVVQGGKGF